MIWWTVDLRTEALYEWTSGCPRMDSPGMHGSSVATKDSSRERDAGRSQRHALDHGRAAHRTECMVD